MQLLNYIFNFDFHKNKDLVNNIFLINNFIFLADSHLHINLSMIIYSYLIKN